MMPRRPRRRPRPGDRGRHGVWRDHLGKSYEYDSTWERRRMVTLDLAGYRFVREGVKIPYVFEGRRRTYLPDLVVYDKMNRLIRLEEIKPLIRSQDPQNLAKWEAAKKWCSDRGCEFRVITERDLLTP